MERNNVLRDGFEQKGNCSDVQEGNVATLCTEDCDENPQFPSLEVFAEDDGMDAMNTGVMPFNTTLTVEHADFQNPVIPRGGGALNVTIRSNTSWTVTPNSSWLIASRISGSGNATSQIHVALNATSSNDRLASVSVRGGTITRQIFIRQRSNSRAGENGGECVDYVRNFFGQPRVGISSAREFWTHSSFVRLSAPATGSIAVWDGSASNGWHGHVGVVETVSGSNFRFSHSNFSARHIVEIRPNSSRSDLENNILRNTFLGFVRYRNGFTR